MTKISCTFVKCIHNDNGNSGYCLKDNIQLGGREEKGLDTIPVCVEYRKEK